VRSGGWIGAFLSALVFGGASPAPATDLSEVLAAPPGSDYSELAPSSTVLDGPYDISHYAQHLGVGGPSEVSAALAAFGFRRAYARTWAEPTKGSYVPGANPRRILSEVVEEYVDGAGAGRRFAEVRDVSTVGDGVILIDSRSIPDSYGVRVGSAYSLDEYFQVVFFKGNALYTVSMASATDDLTSQTLAQAAAEFALAPASTVPPSSGINPVAAHTVPGWPSWIAIAFFACAVVLGASVAVARALTSRSRP
jgi:hypothetical protein